MASPTRDDLIGTIRDFGYVAAIPVGGVSGYVLSQATFSDGPLWAQLAMIYALASVALCFGILRKTRFGAHQASRR